MMYIYDGSYDGLLCAVFDAFVRREMPEQILPHIPAQTALFEQFHRIKTDGVHARRVEKGIVDVMGIEALNYVYTAIHSADEHAGRYVLSFLRKGFVQGARILEALTDDDVIQVMRMSRHVWQEALRFYEFLRFRELEAGVFFAEYAPENDVTALIMPHFVDRFSVQPFIIHDRGRMRAGIYANGQWTMASSENMALPEDSAGEASYQAMWKLFYRTVAIKERINPKLQRQMMPKKFWKDMLEMQA